MNLDAAMDYLEFVEARHRIWERRQAGETRPLLLTSDYILRARKFTNVFRILDPGSQFVLTDLATEDLSPRDTLMRLFLYRHTGRVEVWQWLDLACGGYPTVQDLDDVLESWKVYRDETRQPIFTGAYLVYPQSDVKGTDKLDSIINLTKRLFTPGEYDDIFDRFLDCRSMAGKFETLRSSKGVADFMSMQILTDWGYTQFGSTNCENCFVVAGPGAIRGAKAIDPGKPALEVIKWAHNELAKLDISITLPHGGKRTPSLMDTQNTLCEFSKYVRYQSKPATGKSYKPAHPGIQPEPILPPHW